MRANLLKRLVIRVAACSAVLACVPPIQADSKHQYPESGKVIAVSAVRAGVYTIETGTRIYRMECIKASLFQSAPPQCTIAGKPIAVNDKVHFRFDENGDDFAHIPANGNHEGKLVVLSTELKSLPPLPPASNPSAGESCVVLGRGMDLIESQYSVNVGSSAPLGGGTAVSAGSSPVIPAGPVTAIPVTGGPPVQVIPGGPVTGGVITGVPVTGGPPVTAIPVAPVTGTTTSSPALIGSVPAGAAPGTTKTISEWDWVHYLRVQTAAHVYKLACMSRECWLKQRAPQLGDLLAIRIKDNAAYLSWCPPGPKGEQRYAIVSVIDVPYPPAAPSH